jgi:hypothetical protein
LTLNEVHIGKGGDKDNVPETEGQRIKLRQPAVEQSVQKVAIQETETPVSKKTGK